MKTEIQLLKEFQRKFGFECYNELLKVMSRHHEKIKQTMASRDNWRKKYEELKGN